MARSSITPNFYGAVRPTTSSMELLRNAKWALEHDAPLRVDFFTSENMKRFFGEAAPVVRTLDGISARLGDEAFGSESCGLAAQRRERREVHLFR